jgi:pyridoxamine 5'-phosphate oxidase
MARGADLGLMLALHSGRLLLMQDDAAPHADPFDLLSAWLDAATLSEPNDPNAMTLCTCNEQGRPSARIVLLKDIDPAGSSDRGVVFYTNLESRKAAELRSNPAAALVLHWKSLRRQIRLQGTVQPATPEEADRYFATRHRLSRLGAWASDQSRPLDRRTTLERRLHQAEQRFPGDEIPRPPHWGGFRVVPDLFEFWQDMPYRLHDRTVFMRSGAGWETGKLYP